MSDLVILSDSMAVDYRNRKNWITGAAGFYPMSGWGEFAARRVKPGVGVFNFSVGGYSSKLCVERVLVKPEVKEHFRPGNMLIAAFGGNDTVPSSKLPDRTTTPEPGGTFEKYMGIIIDAAQNAGMNVHIMNTPPQCRYTGGVLDNSLFAPHAEASRRIARERELPFIDAAGLIGRAYAKFTEEELRKHFMFVPPSENWPEGRADFRHYNLLGAEFAWSVIEAEIRRRDFPLVQLLAEG